MTRHVDGKSSEFAVYSCSFSSRLGKYGLFLEDLYVSTEYGGCGVGKTLLKYLARLAVDRRDTYPLCQ
jgi:GNAT superfamily N-acetyltransferase